MWFSNYILPHNITNQIRCHVLNYTIHSNHIMKAIYFDGKNPIFRSDYPNPENDETTTIKVSLAGICGTDIEMLKGYMQYKGVPGHEFVGIVKECKDATWIGKRVVGEINVGCGKCDMCNCAMQRHCPFRTVLGILNRDGAFAEYLSLPKENLRVIPDVISDKQAVFVEPLAAAFEICSQVSIKPDWRIAIVGDGRLAQLIAQVTSIMTYSSIAADITCFGRHAEKLSKLKEFNVCTKIGIENDLNKFDMVIDASGSASGFNDAMSLVKPRGTLVLKSTLAHNDKTDLTPAIIHEVTLVGSRCGLFEPAIDALAKKTIKVDYMTDLTFSLDKFDTAVKRAQEPDALKVFLNPHGK